MTAVPRTLIKICGVTRCGDAADIAALGVDVIGLNFFEHSPRYVDKHQAAAIAGATGGRAGLWGLFVNADADRVHEVLDTVPLQVLQFNGGESPEYCRSFGRPYVKAVSMRAGVDVAAAAALWHDARMLLLDTFVEGLAGGTGVRFDWRQWPASCALPLMLAGGLTPENVGEAVLQLRPAGVDVAGGVEGPVKGLKDLGRCRRFVASVRAVDEQP